MKKITDPQFRYVNAASTDIRKTFARIKAAQKKNAEEVAAKVEHFPQRKHG